MKDEVQILIADDDLGHLSLIQRNLRRSGISNPIVHFKDGQEILDFLFKIGETNGNGSAKNSCSYLLLLDIRMPKVNGVEVLRRLKADKHLKKIPVIVLSTTDDPIDIGRCYEFGCSYYIIKPVKYEKFVEAIRVLAHFLKVVEVPSVTLNIKGLDLHDIRQSSTVNEFTRID